MEILVIYVGEDMSLESSKNRQGESKIIKKM